MSSDPEREIERLKAELTKTLAELALIKKVVDVVPAMLAYWSAEQRNCFANRAYEKWFGIKREALRGMSMRDVLGEIYPLNLPYILGALGGEPQEFEREMSHPRGGPPRHSQAHYIPHIVDGEVHGFCVLVVDVTQRKLLENELRAANEKAVLLATHDYLTGLPNRALLDDRIRQHMALARRSRAFVGVLFLDLDGFKKVNDTFGHAIGDALLVQVSKRLLGALRSSDTVARLGGDEFVIVLPNLPVREGALTVAQKLLECMVREPFVAGDHTLEISLSIGVSIYPDHGHDMRELLANADEALSEAKRAGKNRHALFAKERWDESKTEKRQ
jgi:diguanylate cyclase (GGDEF)-like protein/PAS domain S-box-containing protein